MENFTQLPSMTAPLSMAANRAASSSLAFLSRYFLHQRWVWTVQGGLGSTVPLQAVAHILSMLSEWVPLAYLMLPVKFLMCVTPVYLNIYMLACFMTQKYFPDGYKSSLSYQGAVRKFLGLLTSCDLFPESVFWFSSRIRLSEGFHFAASGEGIVNMVTELPMKVRVECWLAGALRDKVFTKPIWTHKKNCPSSGPSSRYEQFLHTFYRMR